MDEVDEMVGRLASGVATGVLASRIADGTFFDLDTDDASLEAAAACSDIGLRTEIGRAMKLNGPAAKEDVHAAIMSRYFDEQLSRTMRGCVERTESLAAALDTERTSSMFGFAGMGGDEPNRVVFDASNGDMSPLLRVKEDYYFN